MAKRRLHELQAALDSESDSDDVCASRTCVARAQPATTSAVPNEAEAGSASEAASAKVVGDWKGFLESLFAARLAEIGQQVQVMRVHSGCTGTGVPTLCMKDPLHVMSDVTVQRLEMMLF